MMILRALRALLWLAAPSPTIPVDQHPGRFNTYTVTAPVDTEEELRDHRV